MADIELVIKIPEDVFKRTVFYREFRNLDDYVTTLKALEKAVPLPKGHGDLVTKEQMIELVEFYQINPQHFDFVNLIDEIKNEKPIIEADKE